jgi:FG-GAP-like repeat
MQVMSKKQKRVIFYSSPLVVILGLLIFCKLFINRLEADARLLAQTGQAAGKLLNEYRAGVDEFVATKDAGKILACYADNYLGHNEGQWIEKLQSDRDGVRVYEWEVEGRRPFRKADVTAQVARYLDPITAIEESKFKLDSVEQIPEPESAVVRGVLWIRGMRKAQAESSEEAFESHALIRLWLRGSGGKWEVARQELIHGETVTGDRRGFTDITSSAGLDFVSHRNPLFATPEWEPKMFEIIKYGQAGVSAVDYDDDGWYDIFFTDGAHPRLYRNNRGTFQDVTKEMGLPTDTPGTSVGIFADFDNDGYKDLFLGCYTGPSRLYKNAPDPQDNAKRKFTDVTAESGLKKKGDGDFVTVAAAGDYDRDGKLDLYLGRYLDARKNLPTTLFYTRNGEGNSLLHNDGNLRFTDVTTKAGINETGVTLGVAWGDYDNDGFPDMYVVNDFGRNTLLRNNGNGTFTDVSKETGTVDPGYGMSATFGDIDNNGTLDIYTSNVHSGQRWYGQAATLYQYILTSTRQGTILEDFSTYAEIYQLVGMDWKGYGDQVVKGNSLLLNDGRGRFTDVSEKSRVNPFGWYWSSTMFDYDNDGRQDIYAVNGWISGKKKDDL